MDSQSTPVLKVEHSPAESLMSVPASAEYSPLFTPDTSPAPTSTPAPGGLDISSENAEMPEADLLASFSLPLVTPSVPPPPPAEKKQTKKRKSWGQVLPEPKTNLPPRKRAKTEDEKEQRRVERVLRNRKAAQSSRERKRQETEKLEQENRSLQVAVGQLQRTNVFLLEAIRNLRAGGEVSHSPALESLLNSPTLGRSLFGNNQQDTSPNFDFSPSAISGTSATVDPARLSPPLLSISEEEPQTASAPEPSATIESITASVEEALVDMTQHPAAVLCDLQCQSTELPRMWMTFQQQQQALAWMAFLTSAVATAISIFQTPALWVACSLKAGSPLPPSRQVLNTIIWMVTRPTSKTTSTSTSFSARQGRHMNLPSSSNQLPTATPSRSSLGTPSSRTLRSKYLRKILTSSPSLARPLADATLGILRLVSDETRGPYGSATGIPEGSPDEVNNGSRVLPEGWISNAPLPSRETLVTLLWAIEVEERRARHENGCCSSTAGPRVTSTPTISSHRVLKSLCKRRCRSEQSSVSTPAEQSGEPTA